MDEGVREERIGSRENGWLLLASESFLAREFGRELLFYRMYVYNR